MPTNSTLLSFLNNNHFKYSIIPNEQVIVLGIQTTKAIFQCFLDIKEDKQIFICYIIFGTIVPKAKRTDLAELLTKLNYGLMIGNFEMDWDSGEIRFKASINYEGGSLVEKQIENIFKIAIATADKNHHDIATAIQY